MSNIAIFNFENSQVRTALKSNEPYFCLADVAEILEIPRSSDLLQIKKATRGQLDPKGVQKLTTPTGAYRLVHRKQLPHLAHRETKWRGRWCRHRI